MDATTTARVKAHLTAGGRPLGDSLDTWLAQAISAYSAEAERIMNRKLEAAERTIDFDVETAQRQTFLLDGIPVTEIGTVKNDSDREFTDDALDSDDYYINTRTGVLVIDGVVLETGPGALRVVYTGGMGASASALAAAFPDVAQAVEMQVAYHHERLGSLGKTGESMAGGGVNFMGPLAWLPAARKALLRHRM
jgi:hypothetical protein